jgi:RNA polymerase sigma-70 factor (ECF subfamily)
MRRSQRAAPAATTVREHDGAAIEGVTDAECVTRVLAGESAAFETLVRRHARAAYAVAFALLRDADEAEDISQDAFVRAFDRLGQCRDPERFGRWLLRIVRNQSFKRRAWLAVRRTAGVKLAAATPAPGTPEDALQRSELRRTLLAALGGLRANQRTVILLYDLEGYSHREIAARIGISEMMSRRLLSDARAAMRRSLAQRTEGEDRP